MAFKKFAKNREHEAAYARSWRKNNPERQRIRNHRYKVRQELQRETLAGRSRPDRCELCQEIAVPTHLGYRTVFDHDHLTGNFRGWICDRCNKVLGLVRDDPKLLLAMIKYLDK